MGYICMWKVLSGRELEYLDYIGGIFVLLEEASITYSSYVIRMSIQYLLYLSLAIPSYACQIFPDLVLTFLVLIILHITREVILKLAEEEDRPFRSFRFKYKPKESET